MGLHDQETVKYALYDDIYAKGDLCLKLPKYRFPEQEHYSSCVYQGVHDELIMDGDSGTSWH